MHSFSFLSYSRKYEPDRDFEESNQNYKNDHMSGLDLEDLLLLILISEQSTCSHWHVYSIFLGHTNTLIRNVKHIFFFLIHHKVHIYYQMTDEFLHGIDDRIHFVLRFLS